MFINGKLSQINGNKLNALIELENDLCSQYALIGLFFFHSNKKQI
jgi:hypothetical protein